MAGSPAFQFYASDWAHSVSSFTLEERGAYITLMTWSWEHGPVEDDLRRIAIILGVTVAHARRLWERVSKKWERRGDGKWIQPRLERIRAERVTYIDSRRRNGTKGGRPKTITEPPRNHMVTHVPNLDGKHSESPPISDLRSPEDPRPSRDHSVSDLSRARAVDQPAWRPTPERPPERLHNGAEVRRHGMHAWCGRVCVPWGLHSDLRARLGGADADTRLRGWYPAVLSRYEGRELGDDVFDFWRNEFASWVGTVTERPRSREQDTRGSRAVEAFDRASEALERSHAHRGE